MSPSVVNLKDVTPAADGRSLSLPVQGVIMPSSPAGGFGGGGAAGVCDRGLARDLLHAACDGGRGGAGAPPNGMRLTVHHDPHPMRAAFEPTASTAGRSHRGLASPQETALLWAQQDQRRGCRTSAAKVCRAAKVGRPHGAVRLLSQPQLRGPIAKGRRRRDGRRRAREPSA